MAHWLYPANPGIYDVLGAFSEPEACWPINSKVVVGDVVYLYLSAPYQQVGFACDVIAVGLGIDEIRDSVQPFFKKPTPSEVRDKQFMRLLPRLRIPLENNSPLAYSRLREHGLNGMLMGPRKLENNPVLLDYITRSLLQ